MARHTRQRASAPTRQTRHGAPRAPCTRYVRASAPYTRHLRANTRQYASIRAKAISFYSKPNVQLHIFGRLYPFTSVGKSVIVAYLLLTKKISVSHKCFLCNGILRRTVFTTFSVTILVII